MPIIQRFHAIFILLWNHEAIMNEYAYQERHMGTEVSLSFVCHHRELADTIAQNTFRTIGSYERIFSRFLPSSELSLLNQNKTHTVGSEFIAVLTRSLELARLTKNTFNPLVQIAALGYRTTYTNLTSPVTTTLTETYSTDINTIAIDTRSNQVTLGERQRLDFGGILKGYLAAFLADEIIKNHSAVIGCIINIGGDIATRGTDAFHEPFIFFLYNPITGDDIPVLIRDTSLATSGTYARTWTNSMGRCHHIVDTRTQQNPTTDLTAVSVIAQDGALTEALTKLFLTRGVTEALSTAPPDIYHYQYLSISNTGHITSTIT